MNRPALGERSGGGGGWLVPASLEDSSAATAGSESMGRASASSSESESEDDGDEVFMPAATRMGGLSRSWGGGEWGAWGCSSSSDSSRDNSPAPLRRPTGSLTNLVECGASRMGSSNSSSRHNLCLSLTDLHYTGRRAATNSSSSSVRRSGQGVLSCACSQTRLDTHTGWHVLRRSLQRRTRAAHGWHALREQVLEEVNVRRKAQARRDGGEGVSEWPPREEEEEEREKQEEQAPPEMCPPAASVESPGCRRSCRPPRLSEVFGGSGDVRATRRLVKNSLSVEEPARKTRRGRNRRRAAAVAQPALRYATPTAKAPCGRAADLLEVVVALPPQEPSPESGLGTSFEDSAASFSSSSTPHSGSSSPAPTPPPATTPSQVYHAISHYLCSVDLAESEDDSFNQEADVLCPEDLLVLTDNEDTVSWRDLVVSESAPLPRQPDLDLHFSAPPSPAPDSTDLPGELQDLLGADFPLDSLSWDTTETPHPSPPAAAPGHSDTWEHDTSTPSPDEPWPPSLPPEPPLTPQGPPNTPNRDPASPTTPQHLPCITPQDQPEPSPPPSTCHSHHKATTACEEEEECRGRGRVCGSEAREASRERSISCSDNMRAFLLSQPCAAMHASQDHPHAHADATHSCTDNHVLAHATESTEITAAATTLAPTPATEVAAPSATSTPTKTPASRRRRRPRPQKQGFWARLVRGDPSVRPSPLTCMTPHPVTLLTLFT
ncbi:hypothetical protein E2C01_043810 [Portunus trituberculatus]|uniref:Uncharacterized protein n=1 Tax=Portunus trituberculatus TaxID=210409 RepID=A0A5B7FTX0_PORTR|nr:hypothetical protein [Portunus trituberculatus]